MRLIHRMPRIHSVVTSLILLYSLCTMIPASAQSIGEGISEVSVNDWGSGFIATFEYVIAEDDVANDLVRDWRIEVDYSGSAQLNNAYMTVFLAPFKQGTSPPTVDALLPTKE